MTLGKPLLEKDLAEDEETYLRIATLSPACSRVATFDDNSYLSLPVACALEGSCHSDHESSGWANKNMFPNRLESFGNKIRGSR